MLRREADGRHARLEEGNDPTHVVLNHGLSKVEAESTPLCEALSVQDQPMLGRCSLLRTGHLSIAPGVIGASQPVDHSFFVHHQMYHQLSGSVDSGFLLLPRLLSLKSNLAFPGPELGSHAPHPRRGHRPSLPAKVSLASSSQGKQVSTEASSKDELFA
eukprot:scaffold1130_cov195-Pinguiococcus_pyrenoidosus.AAC.45